MEICFEIVMGSYLVFELFFVPLGPFGAADVFWKLWLLLVLVGSSRRVTEFFSQLSVDWLWVKLPILLKNFIAGSASETQAASPATDANLSFFSSSNASAAVGGKASLQPRRTPVSKEEIEAVLVWKISFLVLGFSPFLIKLVTFFHKKYIFWDKVLLG